MAIEDTSPTREDEAHIDYEAFRHTPGFQELKRRFRRFVFPLTAAFLGWFLLYVLLGAYAHEFMARPFLGMNIGLWFGLLQFVSTFTITTMYVAFANRRLDPLTAELRETLEHEAETKGIPQ